MFASLAHTDWSIGQRKRWVAWARRGKDDWRVETHEISIERPFYPKLSNGRPRQKHLCDAHGVEAMDELRRRCELRTCDRRAACPLFWTLGHNQVGKGAITGWQEIIVPAIACGARLWPFDGGLGDLARAPGLAIAEPILPKPTATSALRFGQGRVSGVPWIESDMVPRYSNGHKDAAYPSIQLSRN